jgi:hypothetical protein
LIVFVEVILIGKVAYEVRVTSIEGHSVEHVTSMRQLGKSVKFGLLGDLEVNPG